MTDATTLPRMLRRNAQTMPERPALREKNLGIWQTYSWTRYYQEVRDFALGLAAHGFRRGGKLAVIGDNRPRLYWAQLAAQCLGVVAEDQEQVDKILSLQDSLPGLELVIYDDPRGMLHYAAASLKSFAEVQAAGRDFGAAHP